MNVPKKIIHSSKRIAKYRMYKTRNVQLALFLHKGFEFVAKFFVNKDLIITEATNRVPMITKKSFRRTKTN